MKIQLTLWLRPNVKTPTSYGYIKNGQWLKHEQQRHTRHNTETWIEKKDNGRLALFRNQ